MRVEARGALELRLARLVLLGLRVEGVLLELLLYFRARARHDGRVALGLRPGEPAV